ncbi:MAG TPA: zinc-ribbon domain-containing protein [Polyangiaceae bacterium]|jgi:predicted Zn finger-like uncharacterized protein
MKITCQACQAKYTIADEKVAGKVVKIRCKKCGATIVVNGNETTIGSQPPGAGDEAGEGAVALAAGSSEPWTVNVAEGDQRVMTEPEVVAAYRVGVVTNDTYCWRDGMADWLPVMDIAALFSACNAPGAAAGEFPAKGQDASAAPTRTSTPPAGPPRASTSPKDRNGAPAAAAATAARRVGGRAAAADLFRGAAQAGGEDEVMTSAPPSLPSPGADARGSASKDSGAAAPSMTATTEASGLIDIRQLGQQMRPAGDEKKKTRVDDIMNIGGGGAFGPSLAAPVLTAPSLEHYSQPPPGLLAGPVASQVKSRALMIVAVSAGFFFLVAAVGVLVLIFRGTGPGEERERMPTSATTAAAGSTTAATTGTAAASAEAPAAPSTAAVAASAAPSESAAAAPSASAGAGETAHATAATAPRAFAPAAPREAPAAAPAGAEFNMGETKARLAAIANGVQTCKRGDTSGSGRVEITFGPSGAAQAATLQGGSPFDGTPTGKCVEARFRQAKIPAFGGSPQSVYKSFTIN